MKKLLPYHEMSITDKSGKKAIRVIETAPGDEFFTDCMELFFVWQFPGIGSFAFNAGTNFMMGNDFMYVPGGHFVKFEHQIADSKTILLIINKESLKKYYSDSSMTFTPIKTLEQLMNLAVTDSPFIIHYPANKEVLKAFDLILGDFSDLLDPGEPVILDTIRLLNSLSAVPSKIYSPMVTANKRDPALYTIKKLREEYSSVTLEDLSRDMNYSKAYISKSVKEAIGMSFTQLLAERKRIVGQRLIADSTIPLNDIAEMLGFDTYAGFINFGKSTPAKLRLIPEEM